MLDEWERVYKFHNPRAAFNGKPPLRSIQGKAIIGSKIVPRVPAAHMVGFILRNPLLFCF